MQEQRVATLSGDLASPVARSPGEGRDIGNLPPRGEAGGVGRKRGAIEPAGVFEARVLPGVTFADLRLDVLQRARNLACSLNPNHAWSKQGEFEIMQAAGLIATEDLDGADGAAGVTAAGLLLLGTDAAIRRELPGRWVELRAQVVNADGFDEQDIFQTNLVDQYHRIMDFVARHLPEGARLGASCLRDELFRALTSNFLVHRDYAMQAWGRLVLLPDRIVFENPARTGRRGLLELASMQVVVENPRIAGFFRELGLYSGTGQGMDLLARRGHEYFGTDILVFDRDIFKVFAPYPAVNSFHLPTPASEAGFSNGMHARWPRAMQAQAAPSVRDDEPLSLQFDAVAERLSGPPASGILPAATFEPPRHPVQNALHRAALEEDHARWVEAQAGILAKNGGRDDGAERSMQDLESLHGSGSEAGKAEAHRDRVARILAFCRIPRNREEIQAHVGLNNRDYFRKEILVPLLRQGLLVATIPDKPNSPKQQYRTP